MSPEAITITFTHMPTDLVDGEMVQQLTTMVIEHQHEIAGESQPRENIEAAARAWVCLVAAANSLEGNVRLPLALTMMANGIGSMPTSTDAPSDTQLSQPSEPGPTAAD
jgi:hypothetical protein